MQDKKSAFIIWLIICIFATPILVCMGIRGLGGLIFIWICLGVIWYFFFGKEQIDLYKYDKEKEKKREPVLQSIKEEKEFYEHNLTMVYKEREIDRREKGLVTDSSFREFMKRKGFDVEGTIDIGRFPTWEERRQGKQFIYPSKSSLKKYSDITIVTHKSMNELKKMGINDVKQLLGEYFRYFSWSIKNENGGFYAAKKREYNNSFKLITADDLDNMCVDLRYCLEYDDNINIRWSNNNIYCISREVKAKIIDKRNEDELNKWLNESLDNVKNNISSNNSVKILYNRFIIYRDSGIEIKEGNSMLTDNERKFIILAQNDKSGVYKIFGSDNRDYYQIDVGYLANGIALLK